jgi:hypothetical protein
MDHLKLQRDRIRGLAERWLPDASSAGSLRIVSDTTDFFKIEFGDVMILGGKPFLVRHNAREGRFGLDDEVKYWVKRCVDLESGELKIIKLVFYEKFLAHVGGIEFECFRSPRKEARILKLVSDHPNFMQGYSIEDDKGNVVRIIDYVYGKTLASHIEGLDLDHETYFYTVMPEILKNFIECVGAVGYLHAHGEKHGDIRRDHIILDRDTERYRWIDFDFNFRHGENIYGYDLFGLGNVLMFIIGKGDVLIPDLQRRNHPALKNITDSDLNIVFHHRVANLQKIYPYIPDTLNLALLHFSKGANRFYEHTAQLLEDLAEYRFDAGVDHSQHESRGMEHHRPDGLRISK